MSCDINSNQIKTYCLDTGHFETKDNLIADYCHAIV